MQADRLAFLEELTTNFFSDCITAFGRTDLREDVAAVAVPRW